MTQLELLEQFPDGVRPRNAIGERERPRFLALRGLLQRTYFSAESLPVPADQRTLQPGDGLLQRRITARQILQCSQHRRERVVRMLTFDARDFLVDALVVVGRGREFAQHQHAQRFPGDLDGILAG